MRERKLTLEHAQSYEIHLLAGRKSTATIEKYLHNLRHLFATAFYRAYKDP